MHFGIRFGAQTRLPFHCSLQCWVNWGPKKLLEKVYWNKYQQDFKDRVKELELDGLLDFLVNALAPPWRRHSARQLAAHRLFAPVGSTVLS